MTLLKCIDLSTRSTISIVTVQVESERLRTRYLYYKLLLYYNPQPATNSSTPLPSLLNTDTGGIEVRKVRDGAINSIAL